MADRKTSDREHANNLGRPVGSPDEMAESPRAVFRWDDSLREDAKRCAEMRGETLSEFLKQATIHYIGWCSAQAEAKNDKSPER